MLTAKNVPTKIISQVETEEQSSVRRKWPTGADETGQRQWCKSLPAIKTKKEVSILVKIIISAGEKGREIKDFIVQFIDQNKSDREYVRNRLVGYFWGVQDMGGEITVVKNGEKFTTGKSMAFAIVDGWKSGWEFEIK